MRIALLIYFSLIAFAVLAQGQGMVNNGASLVIKDDVHIVINGSNGNYVNRSTGMIYGKNEGNIHVRGNWINDGTTPAIGNNNGTVILDGGVQRILGSSNTNFNNLQLKGSGDKWLDVSMLVGGGYAGAKTGYLDLTDKNLHMEGKKVVVNNPATTAIQSSAGLLIGETNSIVGYSTIQWNMRDANTGSNFIVPFGSFDFIPIPVTIKISSAGSQLSDSGYLTISTYPTNPTSSLNNRPLPKGVAHLENKFQIENDIKSVDRFYVINGGGYGAAPTGNLNLPYLDREWNSAAGSSNLLVEIDLKPARYNFNSNIWDYDIKGTANTSTNIVSTNIAGDMFGAWVLHNNPPCPVANFHASSICANTNLVGKDSSTIVSGKIDSTVWITQSIREYNTKTFTHKYNGYGNFNLQRKVRSDRGCWDSITKTVRVYPMPRADFVYRDTCVGSITDFSSLATSPTGNPVSNSWLIEATNYSTSKVRHQFMDVGLKQVTLITQNTWGCADTAVKNLEMQPLPQVDFTYNDICEGDLVIFTNGSTTKGQMEHQEWHVNESVVSFAKDFQQSFNKAGGYEVLLFARNSFGCKDSAKHSVLVKSKAKANFTVYPDEIFIHEPYANLVENTSFANFWEWELGDFSSTEYGPTVFHTYTDTGVFSVRLIANNDQNCPDTIFKTIRIKPYLKIYIPNAFSPGNPDALNNTFAPAGMLYGLKEMTMEIYNRWGEQLYFSDDINKPWDGTYLGKPVKEGAYLYMIKLKDIYNQIAWHQGTVTVVR